MTIDEAIKHCEEVAHQNEILMKRYDDASGYNRSHNEKIRTNGAKGCEQLISLYRQLAEWLRELKVVRESWSELTSTVVEVAENTDNKDIEEFAKFLVNYLGVLEKNIMEVKADGTET